MHKTTALIIALISLCASVCEAQKPSLGDVLVSEIMFNPVPGGCDYVELYNNSDESIPLNILFLAQVTDDSIRRLYPIANSGIMEPHSLIVVTTDSDFVASHYTVAFPSRLIKVKSMPAYNDKSGTVAICCDDSVLLDRFDYSETMHSRLLQDVEGVALERRSYQSPTQSSANWYSASSTSGYGTPTATNSQSHETLFIDNDFAVSKNLFSPDGDGYDDLLDLSWQLNSCDLSANITIYDNRGRRIRQLLQGGMLGCQGMLTWDGTNDDGESCARGSYIIVVEAYNEKGAKQSWRHTVSLVRR